MGVHRETMPIIMFYHFFFHEVLAFYNNVRKKDY
jgi:hypothetical protein